MKIKIKDKTSNFWISGEIDRDNEIIDMISYAKEDRKNNKFELEIIEE